MSLLVNSFVTVLIILPSIASGAKILAVVPFPSYSHQIVFRGFMMELARRGHELLVFTSFPHNNRSMENYTEVDLHAITDAYREQFQYFSSTEHGVWQFVTRIIEFSETISDITLSHPVMQRLIAPNSTAMFDLILIQCLWHDALYALSNRFNAPMVGIISSNILSYQSYMFGIPLETATVPDVMLEYTDDMNIWNRMVNTYYFFGQLYMYRFIVNPIQERVVRKHFGDTVPGIEELQKNFSMLLVGTHQFLCYPRAHVPAVIYIGGCHFGRTNGSLKLDLKEILDKSTSGFIYFSLGSNMKSADIPKELRNVLLSTFAELPYTVVWKFETDDLPGKPDNVVIRKWLPQEEVLGHPNIRLFIYHGGLQSTEESIEYAVPTIGFPMLFDQYQNVRRLEGVGATRVLSFTGLTKATFKSTILEMIRNPSYKENIRKFRELLHDMPYHPLDQGIRWLEHVIRHKGAPHLRAKSRDLPLYKVMLLDILAVVLAFLVLLFYILFFITRHAYKTVMRYKNANMKVTPLKKEE
ncbi:UDP-glycosyltransferase UGT5-like [Andrena cerasifolii]|uniref:UDP-glycosyltransferase UGT5-like n=1 Tax=Andrena cerasifolii TaxID=2819439 RepID=UPI00403766D7